MEREECVRACVRECVGVCVRVHRRTHYRMHDENVEGRMLPTQQHFH